MGKMRYILLTLAALIGLITSGCINDAISTSPSDVLTFSRDTVNFDTVFTDLKTPTARLVVANRASKGIVVSSIRFARPETEFRVNVDGVSGMEFRDVEIRARDSIYVFIECRLPETASKEPALTEDNLEFVTNGVKQTVRVEAYGQNVVRLRDHVFAEGERLTAELPYVVFGEATVPEGVTLGVDPGAKVLFHDGAHLLVKGKIEAVGTSGKMIDMRGDRLDNVLPDVGYDILAGQWRGITIAPESFGNRLEYVDMRSTTDGLRVDSCADTSRSKLILSNSWLHNSQSTVLESLYARVDAYGVCFSEAAGPVVRLVGGEHTFNQCTIANNYLFSAIYGPLLSLGHCLPEDALDSGLPLMRARFSNSIIYGLSGDINIGDLTGSDVCFDYVSFKSTRSNDDWFRNCMWETDPMFLTDRPEYYFNYRLKPDSPVISAGNPDLVAPESVLDMDGLDRLSFGTPSLGAYQFDPSAPLPDIDNQQE